MKATENVQLFCIPLYHKGIYCVSWCLSYITYLLHLYIFKISQIQLLSQVHAEYAETIYIRSAKN